MSSKYSAHRGSNKYNSSSSRFSPTHNRGREHKSAHGHAEQKLTWSHSVDMIEQLLKEHPQIDHWLSSQPYCQQVKTLESSASQFLDSLIASQSTFKPIIQAISIKVNQQHRSIEQLFNDSNEPRHVLSGAIVNQSRHNQQQAQRAQQAQQAQQQRQQLQGQQKQKERRKWTNSIEIIKLLLKQHPQVDTWLSQQTYCQRVHSQANCASQFLNSLIESQPAFYKIISDIETKTKTKKEKNNGNEKNKSKTKEKSKNNDKDKTEEKEKEKDNGEKQDSEKEDDLCLVCEENKAIMVYVPCGHLVICQTCSTQLSKESHKCIVCRADYQSIIKTFSRA